MTTLDAACLAISAFQWGGWLLGRQKQVSRWLERLDVENLAKRPFSKLSGGQQQRALLAGALAVEPALLVLDEPTDGLDVRSRQILVEVLNEQKKQGLCTVVISHDVEELMRLADDAVCLTPAEGLNQPSQAHVVTPADLVARAAAIRKPI
jgi:ABC-type Mn2+/Zn2+ transport system ATPase subunit